MGCKSYSRVLISSKVQGLYLHCYLLILMLECLITEIFSTTWIVELFLFQDWNTIFPSCCDIKALKSQCWSIFPYSRGLSNENKTLQGLSVFQRNSNLQYKSTWIAKCCHFVLCCSLLRWFIVKPFLWMRYMGWAWVL